ncbi:hypothetical protein DVH05_006749 [Phytophthora capsici]|nr:hypothetical protein DVH05_006749 [Phytophthora capsici]
MTSTRIRIPSESGDGASVVFEQFTREFLSVLQLTREKQAKQVTTDGRLQVGCFGDVAQKLVPIVDRLQASEQLSTLKKAELLLTFGDKFYHLDEFQAASMFFYEKVVILDEMSLETSVNNTQTVLERILTNTELPARQRSQVEGQTYIQSLFGVAMCCFHNQKNSDGFVKYPGHLEKMIGSLTLLRLGMELAVTMERQYSGQFTWLALNGTILVYSIAKPLQTLGCSKEVVDYLKWSLLVTETSVTLATTKYILWRLQLGSVICDCYEDLALKETTKAENHLKSAENCAQYLQQIVQRLRKEEELDLPLPVDVQRVLTQAETTSALILARVKTSTRNAIETAFPSVRDQICAAIDALEHGKTKRFTLLPSASSGDERLELFELVMEIVAPMLEEGSSVDPTVFPLSFHLVVIRHCLQLSKPRDEMLLLIKSAQSRVASDIIHLADAAVIKCLLELYESLHELRTSWLAWETLPEEEASEYREILPISGRIVPASTILMRLSKAMQNCVFHGDGAISRSNSDLMSSVALQMYHELAVPLLKELDATEPPQLSKSLVRLTCELLLTIHFTFVAVQFDDLLLHGQISLRLATLLSVRGKARRGCQIVRQSIERINSSRDELVRFSSHFHALESAALLSKASFSCAIETSKSSSLRDVGVPGTGSQLGGLSQDLCCIQVDLLLLLYRLELQDAAVIDRRPLTNSKPNVSLKNTVLSSIETKMDEECNHNGYAKVLLNIQRLTHPQKSIKERRALADESIQLLQLIEAQEEKLRSQLKPQKLSESVAPIAPIVISRSSSAITVKVVEFRPSSRKKSVQYYMVFAKSVGAGTAVSLNSNHLPGTATPLYPPHLSVTISNLLPNESYVFAVAAFDSDHEVIHSIGDTSEPVVALNPLPVPMCYGYLAKACDDCQLPIRATQAANYLYNVVISHSGRPSWTANPFYRQALKREVVAQYPIATLNLCIQALLILTHEELGDLDREGKLVAGFDSDAQALTSTQTKALEDCRKIAIAIEIACATDNLEAIRVLSFKGYRLLLPLLHLEGSCDGLTFAALVTFYQALHVIPSEYWDIDTRTICARVGFELFRITQDAHGDIKRATLPLLTAQREQIHPEEESLREIVALFQLLSNLPVSSPPSEAAVAAVASPRAPVKEKPQTKTPITTPRTTEETKANELQSLNEILQSSEGDVGKVFRTLEHQSDHRVVEFAAKVCGVLLGAGENGFARIDQFLSSFKVGGVISSQFRATISSLGGDSLLPEEQADQEAKDSEMCTTETEADDPYLYRWCGELFFIQSVLLYRKIVKLRDINTVHTGNGPDTDCTYEFLHGTSSINEKIVEAVDHLDVSNDENIQEPVDSDQKTGESQLDQLFGEFLDKTTGCCTMFRLANCWQGLQAATQQLWNVIWLLWIAPSQVKSSRLAQLSSCIDALLDMMDLAVNEAGDQHATGQAVALSSVVYTAANALNVDQTWLARLMVYALRAFCASNDWQSIVQKGTRFYSLCGSSAEGSRFSEQNFPVLIYAQQQIVNHQEALLKTAEQELNAFVTAFQEQEAKKKKKKSRLVVEKILSPEELAFRASKQEMELKIQQLVSARDLEREKLAELEETYGTLSRSVNKSLQALNSCHDLVEKYRRLETQDDLPALRRQILASFRRCVVLARQKRQPRVVCQALQEAGDFLLASGDLNAARKNWLEVLDNAYSTLNVSATWREVLTPAVDIFLEGSKDKINGDELWIGLQCCSALAKLTLHSSGVNEQQAVDYALMGAAIFTRFYCCSVPHPTKCFLYGSYRILGQFWPGRELLTDPDRVNPFPLGLFFVLLPELLLLYGHQHATTVMPVITGYEYVAESCLEDGNHVANARRLRVEALVQCGRFHEAFQVLRGLLREPSDVGVAGVVFHDGKPLLDESNRSALDWLLSLKVEHVQAGLEKNHPKALAVHIVASILHFAVALSRHESRYDRDTAVARPAAKKMAQLLLSLVQPSESVEDSTRTWEELQVRRVRADFHLQLSYLAFFEGDWNASKASSLDAIAEINLIPLEVQLELDQKLKFSLVLSRGTFLAQCRVQLVACYLAQTHYRSALETAQLAIEETRVTGEEYLRQQLKMQRLQAAVFLGEREKSEIELLSLREDALAMHTSVSLTYVHMIQTLHSILRSKALVTSQSVLKAVWEHLKAVKHALDALLEHDGWVGVDSSFNLEKRLNLYRPAIPEFVQVHADLAQVLVELPLDLEHENSRARQERALESVHDGLRALEHTTKRMAATKARLLLLKGVLLAKTMRDDRLTSSLLQMRFEDCAGAFTGCIKASIESGYDRRIVCCALIELVDLFGQKLLPDSQDAHVQAAFHYLNLALEVQKHESVLFDTLELQNGSVSSVEKLPASVCISINAQSETEEGGATAQSNSKAPSVSSIVNFFVRLLRMQHILPVCTAELQDTCVLLHSFLVLHHSSYARLACLTDLSPVPPTDPEIRAGLVCALWGQDLAPALAMGSGDSINSKFTFYFTLGTAKVSIVEGSPAAGNDEAKIRMEKFASSPLLSKRCDVDRQSVQHLKAALSSLRTQMEDEDSLLIERNSFPSMLHLALRQIQHLFRLHVSEGEDRDTENLLDRFGTPIFIECTLEGVRRLEDLFSINKGVNITDNELCYFLRDLLD